MSDAENSTEHGGDFPGLDYELSDEGHKIFKRVNGTNFKQQNPNVDARLKFADKRGYDSAWKIWVGQNDKLVDALDRMPFGIIDKKITGIGATTLELSTQVRDSIIVVPTKTLAYNKHIWAENQLGEKSSLYVGSPIGEIKTNVKVSDIEAYLNTDNGKRKKILVVADSLYKVIKAIGEEGYKKFFLMVDEIDTLQSDSPYRPSLENVIDYYFKFPRENRAAVTATFRDFTNQKLMEESFVIILTPELPTRDIKLIRTNNVDMMVVEKIKELSSTDKDSKILIAYNSLDGILGIIKLLGKEYESECGILCSEKSYDKAKHYVNDVLNADNQLQKRIVFMTCTYFAGIDIEDQCHLISVSTHNQPFTLLSIERLAQIAGRCRSGLLSETVIYDIEQNDVDGSLESFKAKTLNQATKFAEALDAIHQTFESDPDLKDLALYIKGLVSNKVKAQIHYTSPIELIRHNIDGKIVPAYFNIDALIERWELHNSLYSLPDLLKMELSKNHHVESEYKELPLTDQQKDLIASTKDTNKQRCKDKIEEIREELIEWVKAGDSYTFNNLHRNADRQIQTFLERFQKLSPYLDADELIDRLIEVNFNQREFRNFNNALIFWALEDTHNLKSHILNKFEFHTLFLQTKKKRGITVSKEDKLSKMQEVLHSLMRRNLSDTVLAEFFSCIFKTSRSGGKDKILGLNPENFPVPLKNIPDGEDIIALLEFPNA